MRKYMTAALLCAGLMTAPSAYAATFIAASDVGKTVTVDFTGQAGGAAAPALSSLQEITFLGTSDGGTTYDFTYSMTNDSTVAARLRSWGFNVVGGSLVGVTTTGDYGNAGFGQTYPEGQGVRDVCLRANGGSNCTDGPNGLLQGEMTSGFFSLTFADIRTEISLLDWVTRYQSINPSQNGATSGVGIGTEIITAVPEPTTWMMLLIGFAGVGFSMRYRKTTNARVQYS